MIKSDDTESRTGARSTKSPTSPRGPRRLPDLRMLSAETRMDSLVALVDHCMAAKDESDALGETFLSYLLAMTIQEARASMRRIGVAKR